MPNFASRPAIACVLFAALATAGHCQDSVSDILASRTIRWGDDQDRAQIQGQIAALLTRRRGVAQAQAARLGLPARQLLPNGRVIEIVDFQGGTPLYFTTHNANAAISTGANLLEAAPYSVTGTGFTVGLWDAGGARTTHQEFGGRITLKDGTALADHSTHVAGTIAAAGVISAAKGMAPSINIDSYEWTNDTSEMTGRGASYPGEAGKIYLSNHSYGFISGWNYTGLAAPMWTWFGSGTTAAGIEPAFGRYDTNARDIDSLAFNLSYYLIIRSAGNDRLDNPATGDPVSLTTSTGSAVAYNPASHPAGDGVYRGGGYDTISYHALAKNVLTIGSVGDAVSGGVRSLAGAYMSSYSSWGPTDDGRIKPDLVANGEALFSTLSTSDSAYGTFSGTSMASPNATGSTALLVGWWDKLFPGNALRASTLKALLIETADDLGTVGPDYQFGWGLINVKAAADLLQSYKNSPGTRHVIEDQITTTTITRSYAFTWDGTSPVRATLCWTDPAGTAITTADSRTSNLVNNLDLKITGPTGTVYRPWIMPFVGDWTNAKLSAAATTGVNNTDNVERVDIASPSIAGTYTATASFSGTLTNGAQTFSLILTGGSATATAPAPTASAITPSAGNGSIMTLDLTGTGFMMGAVIKLTKSGQADVAGTGAEISSNHASFRVNTAPMASGQWNVVLTNPDGQSAMLPNSFGIAGNLWKETFESGIAGWTHSASPTFTTDNWTLSTAQSHSSSHAFFASGPSTKNIDDLYSPVTAIPAGSTSLQFSFWQYYNLQNRSDGGVLEFSVDGGAWFDVTAAGSGASFGTGGYATTLNATSNGLNGRGAWTGTATAWAQVVINLTDNTKFAGHSLQARWRLSTNSSTASNNPGWYVDDLLLAGSVPEVNQPPGIAAAAAAVPSPVAGATTQLSVLGSDDGGEAALTYTWSAVGGSFQRPVSFSVNATNAAKTTTATVTVAGSYVFTVSIRDAQGLTTTSSVDVTVDQTPLSVTVAPASATVDFGASQAFTATVLDQFNDPLIVQPALTWSAGGGGGISSSGVFTANAAGGPYTVTATSGSLNGNASVTVSKIAATATLTNLSQTYTGTARTVGVITSPAGLTTSVTYDGSATAPTNAGSYAIVATINDTNYLGNASGTLVVAKAAASVMLGNISPVYDGTPKAATVTTLPAGLPTTITYDGSTTAPTNAGSYAVVATINDTNHQGNASGTLVVAKAAASVTLDNISPDYDGTPKAATVTTLPAGLPTTITYDGSTTAPTNAGSYAVVATINDTNHQGNASGTFVIAKAAASVTLDNISPDYDGTPKAATVTTLPAGLPTTITYDGSTTAPTNAGSYAVVATVNNNNYQGSASGTFVIAKAAASVTLDNISPDYDGTPKAATVTTSPAGLTTTVTYDGSATVPTNAGSYAVVATVNDNNYQGSASGTLVIAKAAASVTLGDLSPVYDGTPKAVGVTTLPPGLPTTVAYDGSAVEPIDIGVYSVTASVDDANYEGEATATLTISALTFAAWQLQHFTAEEIAAGAGTERDDPDEDGWDNLSEYALGTDPNHFSQPLISTLGPDGLSVTFGRPKGLPDVTYAVEASSDLNTWDSVPLTLVTDGPVQMVRATVHAEDGGSSRCYLRLKISE